jgi:hypothetical protein
MYLPHLVPMITRFGDSVKGTWLEPPVGIDSLYNMLWSFSNFPVMTVICITLLFISLILAIRNKEYITVKLNSDKVLIISWFIIPFFGMFFISFWVPMYISRYLIFALPAYYILLAACIEYLIRKKLYFNIFSLLLISGFAFSLDLNPDKKQPVTKIMTLINQNKDPNTLVLVSPDEFLPTFAYNYNKEYFSSISDQKEYHLTDSLLKTENIFLLNNLDTNSTLLKGKFDKVIYLGLGAEKNAPEYSVIRSISTKFKLKRKDQIGTWCFSLYVH